MYELPLEVLLRVAYFADWDTLLNLLRIKEFRKSVGSFFNLVTKNNKKSSYFNEFSDLRFLDLEAMAESFTNENDINLIEISNSSSYHLQDLSQRLPKSSRNIIVIVGPCYNHLRYLCTESNSITVMVAVKSVTSFWFTIGSPYVSDFYDSNDRTEGFVQRAQRKLDSYQVNFNKIKLNGVKNLQLRGMERILELETQNLFAPELKKLTIYGCHDGILKIFSDEVLENQLTYLKVKSSSVDPSRDGRNITNFKNLVYVDFSNIHNMKNVRFEKLKSVTISLCHSIAGELSVLENVEFPELERLILTGNHYDGYHHGIKYLQAPKLKLFCLRSCRLSDPKRIISLSSLLNFWDADTWDIDSLTSGVFRFNEPVYNIRKLLIQSCDGQVGELGANLARLRELIMYMGSDFKEFPKFTKVPNLKKLLVNLWLPTWPVDGFVSYIGQYYSHVQYLKLNSSLSSIDFPYKSAGCATFQNLKTLHIDNFFRKVGIDTRKLPWRFPNLEELKYYSEAKGSLPTTLTMDFDFPKLRSLTYILKGKFNLQHFPVCFEIRNCPVLESLELRGMSKVTIYDSSESIHYSSVLESDETSTLKFNKRHRTCKRGSQEVVKHARIR
jgi:hypothetical protein